TGGSARKLFSVPGYVGVGWPEAIGRTRSFFFNGIDAHTTALLVGDTTGGSPRKIADDVGQAAYDPPYVTFAREGTLFAQRFDESKLALTGERKVVASNVWFYRPVGGSKHSSAGGTLISMGGAMVRHPSWVDANGHAVPALPDAAINSVRISPDAKRAAMTIADLRTRVSDLFIADLQLRSMTRFTFDGQDHGAPVWSRDGRSLSFAMDRDAPPYVFAQPLSGGAAVALTKPGKI